MTTSYSSNFQPNVKPDEDHPQFINYDVTNINYIAKIKSNFYPIFNQMSNQMRIIHNINYDVTAQLEFRKIIYQNIIRGMKVTTIMSTMVMVEKS